MPSRYLPREQTRRERAPDGRAEPDVLVEPRVLELDAHAVQEVVLRLLHHRLVQVVAFGDLPRGADLVGRPFRRAPVERLAARDDVAHRPHRLLDRRVRVGAVAEQQVDEVEAQALERTVDRLHAGTCGSACSSCWARRRDPRTPWSRSRSCGASQPSLEIASPMMLSDLPPAYDSALSKKFTPA